MNTKTIMSKGTLPLKCNDNDLRSLVEDFIEQSEFDFTFNRLCHYIVEIARQNDLFDKEPNTNYYDIELNGADFKRLNLIIWDMIWSRKIMIDFSEDKYSRNNDYRFIKLDWTNNEDKTSIFF